MSIQDILSLIQLLLDVFVFGYVICKDINKRRNDRP